MIGRLGDWVIGDGRQPNHPVTQLPTTVEVAAALSIHAIRFASEQQVIADVSKLIQRRSTGVGRPSQKGA